MNKIITIVIPLYNMERYIGHCLDSLLIDRDLDKVEILVINDGSEDRSSEIAHGYADRHPASIRVIDKKNGNYGSCINHALKIATGKYVKVLDADDSFDTDNFRQFVKKLTEIDVDMVLTDYLVVDGKNHVDRMIVQKMPPDQPLEISTLAERLFNLPIQMHAVTYRTAILHETGYRQTEGIYYTDQEWTFYPVKAVSTVYYYPAVVYRYLEGRAGQTIEMATQIRNIGHHQTIACRELEEYVQMNHNLATDSYFRGRLMRLCETVYRRYLILAPNKFEIGELVKFDNEISQCAPIVELLEERVSIFGFKYIGHWRRSHESNAIPLRISLVSKAYKVFLFLNRYRHRLMRFFITRRAWFRPNQNGIT